MMDRNSFVLATKRIATQNDFLKAHKWLNDVVEPAMLKRAEDGKSEIMIYVSPGAVNISAVRKILKGKGYGVDIEPFGPRDDEGVFNTYKLYIQWRKERQL